MTFEKAVILSASEGSRHLSTEKILRLRMTMIFLFAAFFLGFLPALSASEAIDPVSSLRAQDPHLRLAAIDRIVQQKLRAGIKPIRRALKDPDVLVRESAAWALGEMRDRSGVRSLCSAFEKEKSLVVEVAIVEALGKIKRPSGGKVLQEAFQNPSPVLRRAGALGLGLLGDWGQARVLLEGAKDPVSGVREVVALALASYRQTEAKDALWALAQDPARAVKEKASFGLKLQVKKTLLETATEGLASNDEMMRLVSARALGLWGRGESDKAILKSTLEHDSTPGVRLEADLALSKINSREGSNHPKAQETSGKTGKKALKNNQNKLKND